jgi:hypothetical protein
MVVGLIIAFIADWRLALVCIACIPFIVIGGWGLFTYFVSNLGGQDGIQKWWELQRMEDGVLALLTSANDLNFSQCPH